MKRIYEILNAENEIIWKVVARDLKEAAQKIKEKYDANSAFLHINLNYKKELKELKKLNLNTRLSFPHELFVAIDKA